MMWGAFFHTAEASDLLVATAYDSRLVALSVLIATTVAVLSLHIVGLARRSADQRLRTMAIFSGALVLGIGVWSMHFIGMLALSLCASVQYDLVPTLISVFPGLLAAWVALRVVMGRKVSKRRLLTGGALVGSGIGAMHYLGMQAMQMAPLLRYQPLWFFLSIGIAVVLATLSLWINCSGHSTRLGHWPRLFVSGGVMGAAISGMHYSAMRAAVFVGTPEFSQPLAPQGTAQLTQAVTLGMVLLSLSVVGVNVFVRYRALLRLAETAHSEMAAALDALKASEALLEERVTHRTQSLRQSHAALEAMATNLKKALRDSDALLSTLNMHAIVSVSDSNGTIIEANDAFCSISGYRREELLGHNHRVINSGVQSPAFWADMWQTIGSGTPWRGEICNRSKSGSLYWVDTFIAPFVGVDGHIEKFVSIRTNITGLKENELELTHHRDRLADLVQQKTADLERTVALLQKTLAELSQQRFVIDEHAIVTISDVAGRITYGNDKFCQISGYTREEFMGQDHHILNSGHHPKGFFKTMYETIARGEVWHAEICNRAKDGSLYWVESTTAAFLDESGKPCEYIAVRTDVTERKRAEEAAYAASRAKSNFLANMSHEIRTPMNGVIGMVDILMQTQLKPEQRRMLGTVHESSLTLLNIINDILDYSKIEAGKLEVEHIPMPLHEVAQSVVQLLDSVSSRKAICLSLELMPGLPTWVLGDPNRVRQVLLNLLGNALKFTNSSPTRAGQVTLRLSPVMLAGDIAGVCLCVRDNGIGMAEDVVDKLFQPFVQADGSTARRFGGTGLGLSITQRLVELMQGEISVRSRLGQGSEFTVLLPLRSCAAADVPGDAAAFGLPLDFSRMPAPSRERAQALGQLILMAEDNEVNRDVMQEQLRLIGYTCDVAQDGAQALQMWQSGRSAGKSRYALLLTDCHMPNLDGFGLTHAIRSSEAAGSRMPIIAITANAMQGEPQRCMDQGMDDYLSKPLRLAELARKLAQWLQPPTAQTGAAVAQEQLTGSYPESAAAGSTTPALVWDPQILPSMVGNDPIKQRRLLDKFLLHAEQEVAKALQAHARGDCLAMADIAHKLKSSARGVGALALGQLCEKLETAGQAGDLQTCQVTAAALPGAFSEVREQVAAKQRV